MRAVVQRVSQASVTVDGKVIGHIDRGLCIVVGIAPSDTAKTAEHLAQRISSLRIFSDPEGKMNLSLLDINGSALIISQFTLHADTHKGHRPSFLKAAPRDISIPLYEVFISALDSTGVHVEHGTFGAHMILDITNDGPVTIVLSTDEPAWEADAG